MFVNILPQRNWIESVLSDDDPGWKIWSKEEGMINRNSGFSRLDANIYTLYFVLMLFSWEL